MIAELTAEELARATPEQLARIKEIKSRLVQPIWKPQEGPQALAFNSQADVIGFGGSAGGGKTDIIIGKALTKHKRTMILRPVGTELVAIRDRVFEIIGTRDGYNGKSDILKWNDRQIEYGATPDTGDEKKYQGRPHDLLAFDEATNFRESVVRYLSTWLRTTDKDQRCQMVLTFNPPTTNEGRWVIQYFAPWLDRKHPNPAAPGELRWFCVVVDKQGNSRDQEVPDERVRIQVGNELTTEFDPATVDPLYILHPQSRTFIPSKISDNKYLMHNAQYLRELQSLPEPLRSQMLHGDFQAGVKDDEWQIIPTAWVEAAQARWAEDGRDENDYLSSIGLDVARGGRDKNVIAKRYGPWFARLKKLPGKDTPDGMYVLKFLQEALLEETEQHHARIYIDSTGVGASPTDLANLEGIQNVVPVVFGAGTKARDTTGVMRMRNVRAWLWWNLRDMLDPDRGDNLALPPDAELLADLTSARWKPSASGVQVEDKDEIKERIGRSPDAAEAVVLACYPLSHTEIIAQRPKLASRRAGLGRR